MSKWLKGASQANKYKEDMSSALTDTPYCGWQARLECRLLGFRAPQHMVAT